MTAGVEFWLSIFGSLIVGIMAGSWAASQKFENRVLSLEHEMWGPKANNGMKKRMETAEGRIDKLFEVERKDVARLDRRNRRQHPDDYTNGYRHNEDEE